MKKVILFISILSLLFAEPEELWTQSFDYDVLINDNEYGYSGVETSDGGYIIAGYAYNGSSYDGWLIKTDIDGNE